MGRLVIQASPDLKIVIDRDHSWVSIKSQVEGTQVPLEIEEIKAVIDALERMLAHIIEEGSQ